MLKRCLCLSFLDVDITSLVECYERQMDVETTLFACLVVTILLMTKDVAFKSIWCHLNVMGVRWTLKQRCLAYLVITILVMTKDVVFNVDLMSFERYGH